MLAAQTARGAASLALRDNQHPESEIDRVTTPRGCTIAGLNEMEHQGFSSAMIKGFVLSARKAGVLFDDGTAACPQGRIRAGTSAGSAGSWSRWAAAS